ncbi:uncharacterized protein LOC125955403 [Anopheles darlingi]|uniref:uncharacterized protein LOC125955403 n=1 Tax=Anopheles darlingi TaxID=43151 RepID=UPI0021003748|nr:uncharacterized protein LOC125955403 [Anopheles darlingi]
MRKYCLLALVPLAVLAVGRPPAAVFEDVFELGRAPPTAAYLSNNENRNGMKAYLRKKYRHLRDPVSQGSGMAAYTAAHERYQNSEETRNDRIRMENLRKVAASVRTKRLDGQQQQQQQRSGKQPKRIDIIPREVFKFELADAMIFGDTNGKSDGTEPKAIRSKRSNDEKRIEPVPRELFRFELADAVISPRKAKLLGGGAGAARGPVNGTITGEETGSRHRHRRSASPDPRDYVKFELEDAKAPEGYTRGLHPVTTGSPTTKVTTKPPVNLRHPFTSSDSYKRGKVFDEIVERPEPESQPSGRKRVPSRKEKREKQEEAVDMSPEESRRIKVRGGKKPKQIANYDDLPLGVQKAIDIAIKESERMNGKGVTVSSETGTVAPAAAAPPPTKYFFGDKKPKTKKPYSATTKITEPKFVPSAKIAETRLPSVEEASNGETGFLPSQPMMPITGGQDKKDRKTSANPQGRESASSSTLQGIPKAWWSYSDLRRPKRLYHKSVHPQQQLPQPLVISPQYVSTFKPSGGEQSKANDLSPGYHHRHTATATLFTPTSQATEEVVIKERPKIQYVIKEIPVPVQVKQPRTKITVQPSISISYDKDITGPGSSESLRGYDNPYGPVELQYDHQQQQQYQPQPQYKEPAKSFQNMKIVIPDPKEESREQEQYYDYENYNHRTIASTQSPPPTHSNEIDTTGSSIAALSALIGQRPSVQLKGLNELLHMPVQMGNHHQQQQQQQAANRPQDSTAPITFPESSTPTPKISRPGYRSVQIENGPKIVYDDSLYHTVQMNPQLQVPMSKEYTPISEVVSDVADADLIGPTIAPPTHATYVIGTAKSTPAPIEEHHAEFHEEEAEGHETNAYRHINVHSTAAPPIHHHPESVSHHYQEQHHHHHHHHDGASDEHYDDSEGYAFGYRVRDFHTGNDFGHVQNHDNGVTRGEYHILLPDGRVQNVRYTADEKGFHADVTYESVHPAPHQH